MNNSYKEAQERLKHAELTHAKLSTQVDSAKKEFKIAREEALEKFGVDDVASLVRKRDEMNQSNVDAMKEFDTSMTKFESALQETQAALSAPAPSM